MDTGRIDSDDPGFVSAPAHETFVRDGYGKRLLIQYDRRDEELPMMPVFALLAQFPDHSDAHRFRFHFRLSGRGFKIRVGDDI